MRNKSDYFTPTQISIHNVTSQGPFSTPTNGIEQSLVKGKQQAVIDRKSHPSFFPYDVIDINKKEKGIDCVTFGDEIFHITRELGA